MSYYENLTSRTAMVLGRDEVAAFSSRKIIIVGVGGVGSWCAEALVRSGFTEVTIVDSDIVCATNINRQVQATSETVGLVKVEEMKRRLLQINPEANITAINKPFTRETHADFAVDSYDYVVDAIDSLSHKCFLIEFCIAHRKKFISSMGAGARTDSSRIKLARLSETQNCSLARAVRQSLRKRRVSLEFACVYSDEVPSAPAFQAPCGRGGCVCAEDRSRADNCDAVDWCKAKKRINGSLVHITAAFGMMIAGAIIRDASGIKEIKTVKFTDRHKADIVACDKP